MSRERLLQAAAWMPSLRETKESACALRVRGVVGVVAYRFAAAVSRNLAEADRVTRVLGREVPGGPVRAFNCHIGADREPVCEEVKPACETCGCTEDAACITYPPHLLGCASVTETHGAMLVSDADALCNCGARDAGQACAWASRAPFICTACT